MSIQVSLSEKELQFLIESVRRRLKTTTLERYPKLFKVGKQVLQKLRDVQPDD